MTSFWIGMMCGAWVGAPIGFLLAAILTVAKQTDKDMGIE